MCRMGDGDEEGPLCDDCYERTLAAPNDDVKLCEKCREIMTRHCTCCGTTYENAEEADLKNGFCSDCRRMLEEEEMNPACCPLPSTAKEDSGMNTGHRTETKNAEARVVRK
jgi:hypothetical protein